MTENGPAGGDPDTAEKRASNGNEPPVEGYVEPRGPPVPDIAYKVINPLVTALLRSPLHSLISDSIMLLTFTGRKSGTEHTTPVGYWVREGSVIVTTHSPWWRNLEGGQPVTLHIKGEDVQGVATPHPEPDVVAEYLEAFIERHGIETARLGIHINGEREPTREELEAGVAGTVVIDIDVPEEKLPGDLTP